jgi:hypothetical protein
MQAKVLDSEAVGKDNGNCTADQNNGPKHRGDALAYRLHPLPAVPLGLSFGFMVFSFHDGG